MNETGKLWAVYTNTDLTEGRGRQYIKHLCRLKSTALRLSTRGYVQGSDCPVKDVEVLELDGKAVLPINLLLIEEPSPADQIEEQRIAAHEMALRKAKQAGLTDAEIALLAGAKP
jgi:hypothetical protein